MPGNTTDENNGRTRSKREQGQSRTHLALLATLTIFGTASTIYSHSKLMGTSQYNASNANDITSLSAPAIIEQPTIIAESSLSDKLAKLSALNISKGGSKNATKRTKWISKTGTQSISISRFVTTDRTLLPAPSLKANNATQSTMDHNPTPKIGGMHICTCLTENNPRNANLPATPKRLRWLHIPKTGTSFISTLWSYAASTSDRYIDLNINSYSCSMFDNDNTSYTMYDFVLMKRYPWEIYGAQNMIPSSSSSSGVPIIGKDTPLGLVGGTQHTPLAQMLTDARLTSSRRYPKIRAKLNRWGSEIFHHNITVAAFFRKPEERIMSAYYDGRHSNGFPPEIYQPMVTATVRRTQNHRCVIDKQVYTNPLECFARYPGIAGCMSRMITGQTCADGVLQESGLENLPMAIDIIMNHLEFVGVMEEWNESICQFHRLFGGKLDERGGERRWDAPLQGEFSNVHKSVKRKDYGIEHLHGFTDVADTVLYEAVKLKFERMVGEERCHKYMTWDELKAQKLANGADLPHLKTDGEGNVCRPKSCSDLGKQCGEWDDGCSKTIICGMCNVGRTNLPSSWRVKCVEGQCIDYCPPWDEKGYWFLSDDKPSAMEEVKYVLREQNQTYLSPVDAVEICEIACSKEGFGAFLNTGLCKCGITSTILGKNLTVQDFSTAHDLEEKCSKNKARNEAIIMAKETQPICCPYVQQKPDLPIGWQRLFTIGKFNLEGEYFDHIRLECGSFQECESVARKKQAEMAVFDVFNSMCHLARNVFDLENAFTVAKDNQYRYAIDLRSS